MQCLKYLFLIWNQFNYLPSYFKALHRTLILGARNTAYSPYKGTLVRNSHKRLLVQNIHYKIVNIAFFGIMFQISLKNSIL